MIDDRREAYELIALLKQHLPLQAIATPPVAKAIREQGGNAKVNDPVMVDSVLYLGDEGGVACGIRVAGGKAVVATSITHLRFDPAHPLAARIQAYQSRRTQRLERSSEESLRPRSLRASGPPVSSPPGRSSRKDRANLAAKLKPKKARAGTREKARSDDLAPRFQAASALWISGAYERAANVFRQLLDEDRTDPHFCRYWLASCLFQAGLSADLETLLRERDDDSGVWRFAQALHAFRQSGDTEDAQRLLVEADHREPGFEDYLLCDALVDARRAVRFDAGQAERAFGCARLFLPAWRAVPGAAAWARRVLKVPPTGAGPKPPERRFPREELRELPLRRETWQVGLTPLRDDPREPSQPRGDAESMWLFGVANLDREELRAMTVIDQPLTELVAWNALITSFLRPLDGHSARPATLVVGRRDFQRAWQPLLKQIGVRCVFESDPQPARQLLEAMNHVLDKHQAPPRADVDVCEFPQSDAVWQADFIRSPAWVMNKREGAYRPWSVLVLEKSRSKALLTEHTRDDPTPEVMLDFLVRTMARPAGRSSERPRRIEVSDSDCYDHLRPRLEAAGIECRLVDEMREFNEFCLKLARGIDSSDKCALAEGRGVTRAQMESYYEAAEYYFRQAPWRRVPGEVPIEVCCDDPALGTRYAIILGRTGVQLGLCVYDDWQTTRAVLGGYADGLLRALAVCYDEAQIMAALDLQLIERLGWPIATPEAWPAAMRIEPGRTPRSPTADELVFLDACLRAIPDFLDSKSPARTAHVTTGTRAVELRLAWKG